tara:strand:+ start:4854 stop:5525 length:672 start_codon:yes stop_codon:yes gene_type:complete
MCKDIFITHTWGNDELDRDNHLRCKEICDKLILKGYTVWFDHYDMYGSIDSSIIKGINNCKVVIICLTEKYCNKINNAINSQTPNDNCYKEWNYSLFKQKNLIPIIMEPKMLDLYFNGEGAIQMYLNSTMFMDMTQNMDDINLVYQTLRKLGVYNKLEKKMYKVKPNNSFDNLIVIFNSLKSISPTKILSPRKMIFNNFSSSNLLMREKSQKKKSKIRNFIRI